MNGNEAPENKPTYAQILRSGLLKLRGHLSDMVTDDTDLDLALAAGYATGWALDTIERLDADHHLRDAVDIVGPQIETAVRRAREEARDA